MASGTGSTVYTINLADEGRLLTLKTILGYEAGVRGLTIGQTFTQLVMEAVDLDAYPEEILAQLHEIQERRSRRAIERSLKAAS